MSYLVLARKYRPQTFAEVVGQEHVTRTLANAFTQGRVHHAFLFCGPRGVGKTTLARILGKALNCERGPTAEPCGVCMPCTTIADGSAVDYYEMDGASNRGIDSVRDLTDAVRYQPAALRKKVYVIDEVHMLTTEAFNALLKTLEEPPPHVTFVMATTEPHKVPNTVLSRCQRYDFKLVPAVRLAAHLTSVLQREKIAADPGAIRLIVRESGGSVRDSLSLADQVISYVGDAAITEAVVAEVLGVADRALTRGLVTALAEGDAGAALAAVDAAATRGVDEVQIARALVRYLRDLAAVQVAPKVDGLVDGTDEERAELTELAGKVDRRRVIQMFDRLLRACDELARIPQPRMVLDLALIDVAALEPLLPLGDLIQRLGELERGIGGGGGGAGGGGQARSAPRTPAPSRAPTPAPARTPGPVPSPTRGASTATSPSPSPSPSTTTSTSTSTSTSTLTAPSTIEHWRGVIDELGAEPSRMTLVGIFENAVLQGMTAERIEVAFPDGGWMGERAQEKEVIAAMEGFLGQHFGRAVKLEVKLVPEAQLAAAGDGRSAAGLERQRIEKERAEREAEARKHPLTRVVLDTFGASIKEIKTDV